MSERHQNPDAGDDLLLRVYVPREGTAARAAIAEQSGVVGSVGEEGRLVLDYEANMHGAVNIKTFADKVHHAAERHSASYPTRARTEVNETAVTEVGVYDGQEVIVDPAAKELLAEWLEIDAATLDEQCRRSAGNSPRST